jgi:hypothetical protein
MFLDEARLAARVRHPNVVAVRDVVHDGGELPGLPKTLDEAVMRGLERDVTKRWQTARDFAAALERCSPAASATEVGEWVEAIGGSALGERARRVQDIESRSEILHARAEHTAATVVHH